MPPYTPVRYVGQEMREFPSRDSCLVVTFQVLDGKNVDLHLMSCLIMCDTQAADAHYAKMKHAQSLWPGFVDSFAQPLVEHAEAACKTAREYLKKDGGKRNELAAEAAQYYVDRTKALRSMPMPSCEDFDDERRFDQELEKLYDHVRREELQRLYEHARREEERFAGYCRDNKKSEHENDYARHVHREMKDVCLRKITAGR